MAGILGPTALSEKTWGIILSETNKNVVWPDEKVLEQKNCDVKLEISQATLGSACKVGERTVVEMQIILDDESETPETFTLVSLREGVSEHVPLNVSLRPPVSIKLASGSGPVTLLGTQDFVDSDDSDSEDDGGLKIPPFKSDELSTGSLPSRKRLQESPEEKTQKKSKTAIKDDLADDENISIKKKVLLNKASFPEIKAEKNLTKDSDDDDDSMDDDDDDLDDSDINGNADELADSDLADSPQIQPPKKISEKKGKI